MSERPLRLECGVQHYDWGQRGPGAFIPSLLGTEPPADQPQAELWIGAHPVKPSYARVEGALRPLPEVIAESPEKTLGPGVLRRCGARLPFLLKVLAAERMLSIQAHPNKAQAEEGFAREEAAGIPRHEERRCYRDDNHKPELIVALTDFFALSRFRPLPQILEAFARFPELSEILAEAGGGRATHRSLFETVLSPAGGRRDEAIGRLVTRLAHDDARRPFGPGEHEHWMLRADRQFARGQRRDPGVAAMLLLNLVRLAPGDALFLGAGELHSYLQGVGVELMANSDNVLRGGLTPKHVDVPELTRVLRFEGAAVSPLRPDSSGIYLTPAEEFRLTRIELAPGAAWRARDRGRPELLLAVEGAASLHAAETIPLPRGSTVFLPAAMGEYELRSGGAAALLFRATTPDGDSAQNR